MNNIDINGGILIMSKSEKAKELFTKRDFQGRWKYRGDL